MSHGPAHSGRVDDRSDVTLPICPAASSGRMGAKIAGEPIAPAATRNELFRTD